MKKTSTVNPKKIFFLGYGTDHFSSRTRSEGPKGPTWALNFRKISHLIRPDRAIGLSKWGLSKK